MYGDLIKKIKTKGVVFDSGLSDFEFSNIELVYGFKFPKSLREFLSFGLPVADGFYNWRDTSAENVAYIRSQMRYVFDYLKTADVWDFLPNAEYFPTEWGKMPNDYELIRDVFVKKCENAPTLVPIYSHRFMPILDIDEPPVLSVYYTDVIYYGANLNEYLQNEFLREFSCSYEKCAYVPFWSDLM